MERHRKDGSMKTPKFQELNRGWRVPALDMLFTTDLEKVPNRKYCGLSS